MPVCPSASVAVTVRVWLPTVAVLRSAPDELPRQSRQEESVEPQPAQQVNASAAVQPCLKTLLGVGKVIHDFGATAET